MVAFKLYKQMILVLNFLTCNKSKSGSVSLCLKRKNFTDVQGDSHMHSHIANSSLFIKDNKLCFYQK